MDTWRGSTDLLSPKPVQLHPLCKMGRFGVNKLGDNRYRVVFGPSRMMMVGGTWPDGRSEYRFVPMYDKPVWYLEKWLDAFEYCGMTRERYELLHRDPSNGLMINGPYPDRGEYVMCHEIFGEPTDGQVTRLIKAIEAGRLQTHGERLAANLEHAEKQESDSQSKMMDICKDAAPSFHGRELVGAHGKRSFKGTPIKRAAEQTTFRGKQVPIQSGKLITA